MPIRLSVTSVTSEPVSTSILTLTGTVGLLLPEAIHCLRRRLGRSVTSTTGGPP